MTLAVTVVLDSKSALRPDASQIQEQVLRHAMMMGGGVKKVFIVEAGTGKKAENLVKRYCQAKQLSDFTVHAMQAEPLPALEKA
jgi:hypothetical protein